MKPVVHVVDDDESFLRSVSRLLRASGYEVATFSSVHGFLQREEPSAPGCVVTDLQMPRQDGLDLQEALARSRNPLPVVFLTSKGDIPTTVRAMRGGAEDFLTKRAPRAQLLQAIERALDRGNREKQARERGASAEAKLKSLSPRERQVLAGVARGLLNKEIAGELGVAERTVKLHRSNLSAKLGLRSAAELALFARESGVAGT
ncbi:MAG: response regulator transcription factor [Chthoniobacterales bacterium]